MKKNYNEIFDGKLVTKALEVIVVLTVIFYIVFSIIKRFTNNQQLFWIPIILFASNFLVLLELIYLTKTKRLNSTKKEFRSLVGQAFLNLAFVVFIISFLF
jgi:hypothetical protein